MSAKRRFWLAGLALAGVGVVLTRVISPQFDQAAYKLGIYGLGILLALAGLGVIMYGIKKGLK